MKKINTGKSFRVAYLISSYLKRSITEQELEELQLWLSSSEQNRQLLEELQTPETMENQLQQFGNADNQAGWQRLQYKLSSRNSNDRRKRNWIVWWRSAAALLLLSLAVWQLFQHLAGKPSSKPTLASQYWGDVLPGARKAKLGLSNCNTVMLNNGTDSSFTESGSTIQRSADGRLVYASGNNSNATSCNTLSIPMGGEYMLMLEDGTKVWLNAATSLRYPVKFNGKERRVELIEGEAYFEVAKNKEKPFIVTANQMEIQAIGTAFDVNTYADSDSALYTTLTEGKVKVVTSGGNNMLLPGEQVKVSGAKAKVNAADVEVVTGWKRGLFVFNGAPLPQVMSQLARWYNVRIEYDSRFREQKYFTGEIKRNVPVSKLLQMMELTGIASFKISEGKILVQPYSRQPI